MSEEQSSQKTVSLSEAMDFVRAAINNEKFDDAADILLQIIAAKPDYAEAVNYLAGVRYNQRRVPEALELTNRAAELDPDSASIRNNLATLHLENGDIEASIKTYREAFHLDPTHPDPIINLGRMLWATESHDEALVLLKRATELAPDSARAHHEYSKVLFALGKTEEALDHSYESLRQNPAAQKSVNLIMRATLRLEGPEAAKKVLEEALKIDPDNAEARHLIGSLSPNDVPDRAADDYVRQTFDGFSSSFDEKLEKLEYRAPELIGNQLDRLREGEPEIGLAILDAGCGTGWSGERLRKHAASLVGIDLSEGMLKKAKQRGIYDDLHEVELVAFLEQHPGTYDAVISADTLCYFGKLNGFCGATRASLLPGGFTIFTVEKMPDELEGDFRLQESGRYQHKPPYVRGELESAGFELLVENEEVLRQESLEDVVGLVYVARIQG